MKVYEVVLPGFNGSTDETDDKILWVAAPDEHTLVKGIRVGSKYSELEMEVKDKDIDFHLPEDVAIDFCEECDLPTAPWALSAEGHRCEVCDPYGIEREGSVV